MELCATRARGMDGNHWDNDPLIKQWREEDMAEIAELEENDLPRGSFGHWSANGCFRIDREWVDYGED